MHIPILLASVGWLPYRVRKGPLTMTDQEIGDLIAVIQEYARRAGGVFVVDAQKLAAFHAAQRSR